MDAFKILSRGASLGGKNRLDLEKFRQASPSAAPETIDQQMDFFSKSTHKRPQPKVPKLDMPKEVNTNEWLHKASKTKITGADAPDPISEFDMLNSIIVRNSSQLGYLQPTPIQAYAIPSLIGGRDLLACAPTGSGKTLAFLAPILHRLRISIVTAEESGSKPENATQAIIVSPTRELAAQTYQTAVKMARGTHVTVGLMDRAAMAKLRKNNAGKPPHLLVSTPMRLVEAIKENLVSLSLVKILILDEADRLLGDGFVEQSDEIIAACSNNELSKAVFSATLPANVEELANSIMHSPLRVLVGHKEAASETIDQKLVYCGTEAGKLTAIRQMLQAGDVIPPILVFVQSIPRAKALFHELLYDKVNVDVIHSELPQSQRDRVITNYKKGDIWVLVCTDVLSRGIDFQGVNLVINYDIPLTAQAYVHRIGRTGRAGRQGKAVTFFTKQDSETIRAVANVMEQSGCEVPDWLLHTRKQKQKIPSARSNISTLPSVIRKKRADRKSMIEAAKRRASSS